MPPRDDVGTRPGAPTPAPARPRPDRAAIFRGASATLEPLASAHAEALWPAAAAAPESWAWLPHGPFPTAAAFRGYLRFAAMSDAEMLWAVRPHIVAEGGAVEGGGAVSGPAAGWLGLLDAQPAHAAIELGNIWFPPGLARTRAATEAMFMLLDHVFTLGYRRVAWKCDALNTASRRAAERLGFVLDGVLRAHMINRGGARRDSAYYSLLEDEWPPRRAALLAWLDPANFDEKGRARAPATPATAHRGLRPMAVGGRRRPFRPLFGSASAEQALQLRRAEAEKGRTAVAAGRGARRFFHLPQQRRHLGGGEPAAGAHRAVAG